MEHYHCYKRNMYKESRERGWKENKKGDLKREIKPKFKEKGINKVLYKVFKGYKILSWKTPNVKFF